jgi:hypothetical protein
MAIWMGRHLEDHPHFPFVISTMMSNSPVMRPL